MIDFPREPNPGENLDASWGARVVRALRALFPMPGPGINVSTGPSGTTISVAASRPLAASVECCPAVIKGEGDVPGTYEAELYPYGLGKPPQLKRVHIAITERGVELGLPVGTIVLAHAVAIVTAEDGRDVQQEG